MVHKSWWAHRDRLKKRAGNYNMPWGCGVSMEGGGGVNEWHWGPDREPTRVGVCHTGKEGQVGGKQM